MAAGRILITGGAGFLGAHLADRARRDGLRVRLFDLAEPPGWARDPGVEHVQGDVRDPVAMAAASEGVDIVVHAAFASPRQSREDISSVNVAGTRNACAVALGRGVRRFILISSTIVLRSGRVHPVLRNAPLTRLDLYRGSRVEAERILGEYASKGLPGAIARPKTLVGPGRVSAFAIIFEWIRLGRPVPVLGDGGNRYQLLDVRDMAEGIRLLATAGGEGVFSFGAREFQTVREDLQTVLDHAGTGSRLRFVPGRLARMALRGVELASVVPFSEWHYMGAHGEDSVVDVSRAQDELRWRPEKSNAQALVDAYDWYVESVVTRTARSTQPVPLAHEVLKRLGVIFRR